MEKIEEAMAALVDAVGSGVLSKVINSIATLSSVTDVAKRRIIDKILGDLALGELAKKTAGSTIQEVAMVVTSFSQVYASRLEAYFNEGQTNGTDSSRTD